MKTEPDPNTLRTEAWHVDPTQADRRLDIVISSHFENVSRAQIKRWIDDGRVCIDGTPARPSRLCRDGELVEVLVPKPIPPTPQPEKLTLDVIFEDAHVVVVDKPAGMVVHPGPGHPSGTLVNALLAHCDDLSGIGGVERPGIVHRLDAGTTGVIVVAKHDRAHRKLSEAFQARQVEKHYAAIVYGKTPESFVIDRAIGRDPRHRTKISSRSQRPKTAVSAFRRVESLSACSLLACQIHTGRTHQIRVHLSEAGHPIVGDRDYGARGGSTHPPSRASRLLHSFARPALHAERLSVRHPETNETMTWEAPLPDDMTELLQALRQLSLGCES